MEDIYYYNSAFKPVLDMDDIDIFIGYQNDPTANIWSVSMLNGDDKIIGNKYQDVLKGGYGNDTLNGNNGKDTLYGEAHRDSLYGGNEQDKFYGGSGNDMLYG